jgi:hypothetical protein
VHQAVLLEAAAAQRVYRRHTPLLQLCRTERDGEQSLGRPPEAGDLRLVDGGEAEAVDRIMASWRMRECWAGEMRMSRRGGTTPEHAGQRRRRWIGIWEIWPPQRGEADSGRAWVKL